MWEYTIRNLKTDEQTMIWGYSYEDACRRWNINPKEWWLQYWEYVD